MKRRTLLAGMLGSPALLAQPAIPLRRLGSTTLTVSVLGFGCAPGLKDAALYRRAIDLGVTYFHAGDRDSQFDRDILRVLLPPRDRNWLNDARGEHDRRCHRQSAQRHQDRRH